MLRHYHHLGVLPEPDPAPGGHCDCTAADLVRVLRIRMLVEAGVPLREVPGLLSEEGGALPPIIDTALERCRSAAGNEPLVLEVLAREQEALELFALTHGIPPAFEETYRLIATDKSARTRYLDLVERMARLCGHDPADCAQTIQHDAALRSMLVPAEADDGGGHPLGTKDDDPASETDPLLERLVLDRAQRAVPMVLAVLCVGGGRAFAPADPVAGGALLST